MTRRLAISINSCWNFVNFRAGLVRALIEAGYEILALAPADEYADRLRGLGCRIVHVPVEGRGKSPVQDARLLLAYYRILRKERPRAFLGYTIKPNIYGSLAAHALGIPVINNIAGLGSTFTHGGWLHRLVRILYRRALARSSTVFFQNPEDRDVFVAGGLVSGECALLLPGSGVDLDRFTPPHDRGQGETARVFLMVARALWSKGVGDFAIAAAEVRSQFPAARFQLLGILGTGRDAVSRGEIEDWVARGHIEFLGKADDVRPYIAGASCIVLPTFYREGTPRALLEAAAMARPLIATDVAGCREVVRDGENGFLVPPRRPDLLAAAMIRIVRMSPTELCALGRAARARAEREFDEHIVIQRYLDAVGRAIGDSSLRQ